MINLLKEKVGKEFNDFMEKQESKSASEVLRDVHMIADYIEMESLVMTEQIFDDEVIEILLSKENALDALYQIWVGIDQPGADSDLEEFCHSTLKKELI